MVVMIPVFGDRVVPVMVKAGLSLLLSLILYPLLNIPIPPQFMTNTFMTVMGMAGEVLIGILMGFAVRCIFAAVQAAGEMVGVQLGVSMANVFDPLSSIPVSIISEFLYLMALLVFIQIDAHHILLAALADSFHHIPPFAFAVKGGLMKLLLKLTADVFWIAVKLSAPIIAVAVLINIALAVIARTVPQINIFIVGFPIQIAVGLIFLGLAAPFFVMMLDRLFLGLPAELRALYSLM